MVVVSPQVNPVRHASSAEALADAWEAFAAANVEFDAARRANEEAHQALDDARTTGKTDTTVQQNACIETCKRLRVCESALNVAAAYLKGPALDYAMLAPDWHATALVDLDYAGRRIEVAYGEIPHEAVRPKMEDFENLCVISLDDYGQWSHEVRRRQA